MMPNMSDSFLLTTLRGNGSQLITRIRDNTETVLLEEEDEGLPPPTNPAYPTEYNPHIDMRYEEAYPIPDATPKEMLYQILNIQPGSTEQTLQTARQQWQHHFAVVQTGIDDMIQNQVRTIERIIETDQNDPRLHEQVTYATALEAAKTSKYINF